MTNFIVFGLLFLAFFFVIESVGGWVGVKKRFLKVWKIPRETEEYEVETAIGTQEALNVISDRLGVADAVDEANRQKDQAALKANLEEILAMVENADKGEKTTSKARKTT